MSQRISWLLSLVSVFRIRITQVCVIGSVVLASSSVLLAQDFTIKTDDLRFLLESKISNDGKQPVANIMLDIKHGGKGYACSLGVGTVGRSTKPIEANYQYRIASITKTFVAVVILQLIEEGKLTLDDLALPYLQDLDFLRFENFHHIKGQPYAQEITIQHLLNHTSGLADIFTDAESKFLLSLLMHKKRKYTLKRIVDRYFKYNLHQASTNLPGEGYHYSDMNFMALGFIAQEVTGETLSSLLRQRIIGPLGMENTYFEYREPSHGHGLQIDAFYNKLNFTKKVNASYEWGGGGIISTNPDLVIFMEALFSAQLFSRGLLKTMINVDANTHGGDEAGLGIFRYHLGEHEFYGHGGFYGSLLLHAPDQKFTLAINIGQVNAPFDVNLFLEKIVNIVAE